MTTGANCGQAPAELCLDKQDCDEAWLTFTGTFPEPGQTDVLDNVSVEISFNRSFERFNTSFVIWSSSAGAVLFSTEEAEDRLSVRLTPSQPLLPNTTYSLTLLSGAASATDGASTPTLEFGFTTGLPTLEVSMEQTLPGAWPVARLSFGEDVEVDALVEALQWKDGAASTDTRVIQTTEALVDEAVAEVEQPNDASSTKVLSKRVFWVRPSSLPTSPGNQTLTVEQALLSSAEDSRVNEDRVFEVPSDVGISAGQQWLAPELNLLIAQDLQEGFLVIELGSLPEHTSWLELEVSGAISEVETGVSRALIGKEVTEIAVDLSTWAQGEGTLNFRWTLTDEAGVFTLVESQVEYDFIVPEAPIFSETYPTQWAYDSLAFSLEVAEAGTLEVYVGLESTQSFEVESGINSISVVVPREFQVHDLGFALVKASGNRSELLVAQVERIPYPCLGALVDGTLLQALSGISELGALVIEDDGEGNVDASIPLNIGLVDDATLHSALPTRSFGRDTELLIRPAPEMVTLVRFDSELLLACARIQSVTLSLNSRQNCTACPQPTTWEIAPLLVPWREEAVTWANASDNTQWSNPGTGADDVGPLLSGGEWVNGKFRYAISLDDLENLSSGFWQGFRLSNFDANVSFYSSESALSDLRPKLELSVEEVRE